MIINALSKSSQLANASSIALSSSSQLANAFLASSMQSSMALVPKSCVYEVLRLIEGLEALKFYGLKTHEN